MPKFAKICQNLHGMACRVINILSQKNLCLIEFDLNKCLERDKSCQKMPKVAKNAKSHQNMSKIAKRGKKLSVANDMVTR